MTNKSERLKLLHKQLKELTVDDMELNHINADKLLVATLKLMADNTIDKYLVNEMIDTYESIDKGYI